MRFRHLALKNVRGNWHRYIAFFLSCVFSVTIFYIFASFIYHPDVQNGHIEGGEKVRSGLLACEYVIMIFSFFFIMYSESAFIKSRKKEFGLFSLFGMVPGQIKRLVFYESMLIGMAAIVGGLILGTVCSKLFLMAMTSLLKVSSPIGFQIVPTAVLITVVGFLAVFFVITLVQLFGVGKSEIIDLLRASRKPKSLPVFSKWLVALAVLTLGAGYALAYFSGIQLIMFVMFPVLGLVIVGTYFLFTQASVAVFKRLRKRPSVFYKRTNLITLSQMIFKMKDNSRVLFMVAILSAVVLTASGTFYIFFQGMTKSIADSYPQTIGFVEKGLGSHKVIDPGKIENILHQDDVKIQDKVKLVGTPISIQLKHFTNGDQTAVLVSDSMYNKTAKKVEDAEQVDVQNGHAVFIANAPVTFFHKGNTAKTAVDGKKINFRVNKEIHQSIVNLGYQAFGLLVVNDRQYQKLTASVPDSKKFVSYGYDLKNWESTQPTIEKIEHAIPKDQQDHFFSRVEPYLQAKQFGSLTMFIGIFVSLLFFIAAGSLIYFKLFTELQEDKAQFQALRRIGMTDQEMRKVMTRQIGLIFFVPFVVGAIHALFAFKMLQNMKIFGDVWAYGGIVIGIFFVMQLIYFFITRQTYVRQIVK